MPIHDRTVGFSRIGSVTSIPREAGPRVQRYPGNASGLHRYSRALRSSTFVFSSPHAARVLLGWLEWATTLTPVGDVSPAPRRCWESYRMMTGQHFLPVLIGLPA